MGLLQISHFTHCCDCCCRDGDETQKKQQQVIPRTKNEILPQVCVYVIVCVCYRLCMLGMYAENVTPQISTLKASYQLKGNSA